MNNQSSFIKKETFLSEKKTEQNKKECNKQRNFSVSLARKARKELFNNLNVKCITDNKIFWKIVKYYFSNKSTRNEKTTSAKKKQSNHHNEAIVEKLENLDLQNKVIS